MSKYIILMASGNSRRFGSNKLLTQIDGLPLYRYSLNLLGKLQSPDCPIIVVSRYEEIRREAECLGFSSVDCPQSIAGVSHTIKAGIHAIHDLSPEDYLLFMVADQPYLKLDSVQRLLGEADCRPKTARLFYQQRPGNPVLFSAELVPELLELTGDQGGGAVVKKHSCVPVYVQDEKELMDIDSVLDIA